MALHKSQKKIALMYLINPDTAGISLTSTDFQMD